MITPPFQKTTFGQLQQLAPELYDSFQVNFLADVDLIYFDSDTHLDKLQYDSLEEELSYYIWAVNGNLVLENCDCRGLILVKGDLICDNFNYDAPVRVQGKIIARHSAWFVAEDHEMQCPTASLRLETPYVFSWYYSLQKVSLLPGTAVFIICDSDDLADMNLQDPYFYWKEEAFVLRPELLYPADSYYSDVMPWNPYAIEAALEKGETVFIDGFTPECMPLYRQAGNLLSERKYAEAYRLAQQADSLSPGYYYPWYYMGYCLHASSAFEQDIPLLQKAVHLFPEKHKNLQNQAADYLELSALCLRQLDVAMEWSSFSIESTRNNTDDDDRWFPYRIRGEAYLLVSNVATARVDLETAVKLKPTSRSARWLLSLVYHQMGKAKNAAKHHRLAVQAGTAFAATYDKHQDTDFLQAPATRVDWA